MIDQYSAFSLIFFLFFIVGVPIFLVLRRRRVFVSDRACMYISMALAIHLVNLLPVITKGRLVSYRSGEAIDPLDIFGVSIFLSLFLYWVAVLSERSLKKTLSKQKDK